MKRIGLSIGLNRVNPGSYDGWDGKLVAAVPDAVAFNSLFAQAGLTSGMLLDEAATLRQVVGELELAADELDEGDAFVWSYSGHGTENEQGEFFCLFDGELGDKMLHNLRARFKPGVHVVSIFDSCYSGGMSRGAGTRNPNRRVKPIGFPALRRTRLQTTIPIQATELLLTASRTTEESAEDERHGYFTGALLDTLRTGETWKQWFESAAAMTTSRNPFQHPVVYQLGPQTIFPSAVFTFEAVQTSND